MTLPKGQEFITSLFNSHSRRNFVSMSSFGDGVPGGAKICRGQLRAHRSRAQKHLQNLHAGKFIPFYLGRNKNIRSRVMQHVRGKKESATYGLKLLSREYLLKGCKFRASGIVFKTSRDAYFCVEFLEAAIRKSLHPIIGKQ
jgi:hypothetical protein